MSALGGIAVIVENPNLSGNVPALLHEIRHALERLLTHGEESAIDLNTLPLTPADAELLFATLGRGEVEIHLEIMGESLARETTFAGVWLIEHKHADGSLSSRHLEICRVPAIVMAQREDMEDGLARLAGLDR